MRSSGWRGLLVVTGLLAACGDSSTGEESGASATTSGSGPGTTSNEMTTPGTTVTEDDSDSLPATTTADSTGAPASTGTDEGTSGGSTSGEAETAAACEPPPPAGNACLECAVANCCTAWVACQANEPCACVVDCHVVNGGSLGMCSNQCNLDSELYQALYFCGQQSCLGTCEWDCC